MTPESVQSLLIRKVERLPYVVQDHPFALLLLLASYPAMLLLRTYARAIVLGILLLGISGESRVLTM